MLAVLFTHGRGTSVRNISSTRISESPVQLSKNLAAKESYHTPNGSPATSHSMHHFLDFSGNGPSAQSLQRLLPREMRSTSSFSVRTQFHADCSARITLKHCHILVSSYPHSLINTAIAGGLLFLHTRWGRSWDWSPPFKAWPAVTVFFLVSNFFLVVVPLVPPAPGYSPFEHLPYFVSSFCLLFPMCY